MLLCVTLVRVILSLVYTTYQLTGVYLPDEMLTYCLLSTIFEFSAGLTRMLPAIVMSEPAVLCIKHELEVHTAAKRFMLHKHDTMVSF